MSLGEELIVRTSVMSDFLFTSNTKIVFLGSNIYTKPAVFTNICIQCE